MERCSWRCLIPAAFLGPNPPACMWEGCSVEDGYLKIYTNDNISSQEQTLSAENFTITLGDTVLPCSQAVPFSDTGEGVAYVFLVDVSGSISSDRLEQMKEYLRRVTETLKDEDRVCLITLGNELAVGDFISGRDAITEEINGITGLYDDTNLYYGISQSLQILETSAQSLEKKALLVLSDGEDEQAAGITREEVSDQVEAAGIPVFTAAMLGGRAIRYSPGICQDPGKLCPALQRWASIQPLVWMTFPWKTAPPGWRKILMTAWCCMGIFPDMTHHRPRRIWK